MDVNLEMLFQSTIPLLALIGGLIAWGWKRLDRKFDKIDERLEKIDERFEKIFVHLDARFDKIDEKLTSMNDRLTRLEVRDEIRTVRVVHTGTDKVIGE